jgi:hypothetical protein
VEDNDPVSGNNEELDEDDPMTFMSFQLARTAQYEFWFPVVLPSNAALNETYRYGNPLSTVSDRLTRETLTLPPAPVPVCVYAKHTLLFWRWKCGFEHVPCTCDFRNFVVKRIVTLVLAVFISTGSTSTNRT